MKNSIDKDSRKFKNVFNKTTICQKQNSKYPLGEDFYCIRTDDKVLKNNGHLQIKDSNI